MQKMKTKLRGNEMNKTNREVSGNPSEQLQSQKRILGMISFLCAGCETENQSKNYVFAEVYKIINKKVFHLRIEFLLLAGNIINKKYFVSL